MPIIQVDHVTKEFQLGELESFKSALRNQWRRVRGHPVEHRPLFKALDDISFTVEPGEVLGIIGHNGAGKSTLLKLLAQISNPSSGRIATRGRIAPLIEVGAGFVSQLTGRENVYLNAAILGIPKRLIEKKFDEIVAFAEMEQFIDTPVKRYSSGMRVKLAFAVATSVDAEILIVDEVLAVGDLAFQRKCFDRMETMIKEQNRTVLLVSHNIRQVQRLCNRVILLDHGRIALDDKPSVVCNTFYEQSDAKITLNAKAAAMVRKASGEVELREISFRNSVGEIVDNLTYNEDFTVEFTIKVTQELRNVTFGFGFHTTDFLYVATHNTEGQLPVDVLPAGTHRLQCSVSKLALLPGVYSIRFGITAGQAARIVFYGENLRHLQILGAIPITSRDGFVALNASWNLAEDNAEEHCHPSDLYSQ